MSTQRAAPCQCQQHRPLEIPSSALGLTQHPTGLFASTRFPSPFGPACARGENTLALCNL